MYRSISGADMGMRSKTDWDMITASQFPVAIRATNVFRPWVFRSSFPAASTRAWG